MQTRMGWNWIQLLFHSSSNEPRNPEKEDGRGGPFFVVAASALLHSSSQTSVWFRPVEGDLGYVQKWHKHSKKQTRQAGSLLTVDIQTSFHLIFVLLDLEVVLT